MIEHATACLKNGGKSVSTLPTILSNGHRPLHSAFWTHGAGDIDLPQWWFDFLSRSPVEHSSPRTNASASTNSNHSNALRSGLAFDFLYPPKTLEFVNRLATRKIQTDSRNNAIGHNNGCVAQTAKKEEVDKGTEKKALSEGAIHQRYEALQRLALDFRADSEDLLGPYDDHFEYLEGNEVKEALKIFRSKDTTTSNPSEIGTNRYRIVSSSMIALKKSREAYEAILEEQRQYLIKLKDLTTRKLQSPPKSERLNMLRRLELAGQVYAQELYKWLINHHLPKDQAQWTEENHSMVIKAQYLAAQNTYPNFLESFKHLEAGMTPVMEHLETAIKHGKYASPLATMFNLAVSFGDWRTGHKAIRVGEACGLEKSQIVSNISKIDTNVLGRGIRALNSHPPSTIFRGRRFQSQSLLEYSCYKDFLGVLIENFLERKLKADAEAPLVFSVLNALRKIQILTHDNWHTFLSQLLYPKGDSLELRAFAGPAYALWKMCCAKVPDFSWEQRELEALLEKLCSVHHPGASKVFRHITRLYGFYPYVCKQMVEEHSYQGQLEEISRIYKNLKLEGNAGHDLPWLNYLVSAAGSRGQLHLIEKYMELARSDKEIKNNSKIWNSVIQAYARSNDITGSLKWYNLMQLEGPKPTFQTHLAVIRTYASRGELLQAQEHLNNIRSKGYQLHFKFIEALIYAHIQNEDVEGAEQLLLDTTKMDMKGSRTSSWNLVINAYAVQRSLPNINIIHQLMIQHQIPEDSMTYAAIMNGFCRAGDPHLALKIIKEVMPRKKLRPSTYHYNILMAGYLAANNPPRAMDLYRKIRRGDLGWDIVPDFGTDMMAIRAMARMELKELKEGVGSKVHKSFDTAFQKAESVLKYYLEHWENISSASVHYPLMEVFHEPLNEVYTAGIFTDLIWLYGSYSCFSKVQDLFDQYLKHNHKYNPDQGISPPIRLLSALMNSFYLEGKHIEVERTWKLAFEKVIPLAYRVGSTPREPDWVLPSRARLLNLPLYHYMRSLNATGRFNEIRPLIESLQVQGFKLDTKTWNFYIRETALKGNVFEAFDLHEKYVIANFNGWSFKSKRRGHLLHKKIWTVKPGPLSEAVAPRYSTLVCLAKAMIDFRTQHAFSPDRHNQFKKLHETAPRTVEAITFMPRVNDKLQKEYLRPNY
jgi:pentatricopeptide repeat protein